MKHVYQRQQLLQAHASTNLLEQWQEVLLGEQLWHPAYKQPEQRLITGTIPWYCLTLRGLRFLQRSPSACHAHAIRGSAATVAGAGVHQAPDDSWLILFVS
jgi:hypothetical protein